MAQIPALLCSKAASPERGFMESCIPVIFRIQYHFQFGGIRTHVISGFGGMGDRFDPIFPPALIVSI